MAAPIGTTLCQLRGIICRGMTRKYRYACTLPLNTLPQLSRQAFSTNNSNTTEKVPLKKPYTPVGKHDEPLRHKDAEKEPLAPFPDDINPKTGEKGGPRGPEPTRYGDWERKGRCIDF
ncbi:succinate dehydrogenase assembly factor 4, mitochondrial-like [Apostichopus japonicus]|uniref:succinate dehydrogenase assembly factor 4, mitochondrial-like n=1 Tax=Stichopus japonicus TaxID=307972 RepID=UPI003AB83E69